MKSVLGIGFDSLVLPLNLEYVMIEWILTIIGIMLAVIISDVVWVFYIKKVNEGKEHQASILSLVIYINSAFVVIAYVTDYLLLIPALIASYFGTYIAVRISKGDFNMQIENFKRKLTFKK